MDMTQDIFWCNIAPGLSVGEVKMPRQSITLSEKNNDWLKSHVGAAGEYANKSELVNDIIRRARRAEFINEKLAKAEQSGHVDQSPEEILAEFKADLKP
ncbi:CopG family transcriptional regulator [Alteromonas sp.]|uniref:ribbon-helix-helix domain-containing protein n=1 Tax=Alteromonas sp. TaxID=232 RepID=UPI00257E3F26|nr:CopG family transcriptional regulator [Alteromonas sp.]|tara:strand:- start:35377 stop:35673 length:297 start_codon:yes stop_codon:yes gene_type:complete